MGNDDHVYGGPARGDTRAAPWITWAFSLRRKQIDARTAFEEAALTDLHEEEFSSTMSHESPEKYWDFMTDIAAPVVGVACESDTATQAKIRHDVLALAREATQGGEVRLRSSATVIV
ncbi:hypothetical protein [Rhizobium grahamii]|uniref:hypothetical protein n=1 Tax=Rhizobium grahamii TaxID=1120045 RepID=UPI0002EEC732|nr:hypothetical protein [Rhizobium grahamii]